MHLDLIDSTCDLAGHGLTLTLVSPFSLTFAKGKDACFMRAFSRFKINAMVSEWLITLQATVFTEVTDQKPRPDLWVIDLISEIMDLPEALKFDTLRWVSRPPTCSFFSAELYSSIRDKTERWWGRPPSFRMYTFPCMYPNCSPGGRM